MTIEGRLWSGLVAVLLLASAAGPSFAQENASNPLSKANNTDLRYKRTEGGGSFTDDAYIDGAYMLRPDLKFKYELHYNRTNATGKTESGFEKLVLKPILFPSEHKLGENWGLRTAVGLEWTLDLGDTDKGIGTGSDQLAPFVGLAFGQLATGLTLIPLLQQNLSYNGDADINLTTARLIALQPFASDYWAKLDLKIPYDWTNAAWPATAEVQLGYNINARTAVYLDGLLGIGSDRPYDGGLGAGIRFKY